MCAAFGVAILAIASAATVSATPGTPHDPVAPRSAGYLPASTVLPDPAGPVSNSRATPAPAYKFLMMAPDRPTQPMRWNPCQVITWEWLGADTRGTALMTEVIKRMSIVTGIRFARQRIGSAEIQVKFASLPAPAIGLGGPVAVRRDGWYAYERGTILVESRRGTPRFSDAEWTELLTHELGHVMGLAHVDSPGEIMYPQMHRQTTFGPGDLVGLRRLGRSAGCIGGKPLTRPSPPRSLRMLANSGGNVRLGWGPPTSFGNAADVSYRHRLDGPHAQGRWWRIDSSTLVIRGLRPGLRYHFLVVAANDTYSSPAAEVSFTARG